MITTIDPETVAADAIGNAGYGLLIGGEWRMAEGELSFPVVNPATGTLLSAVPDAGAAETGAAIDARLLPPCPPGPPPRLRPAARFFGGWPA
jgi:hypothetical protein